MRKFHLNPIELWGSRTLKATIVLLPGDGIGPEVVGQAVRVLDHVAEKYDHELTYDEQLLGAIAIDETGSAFPEATLKASQAADAILLGAVGDPKYDDPSLKVRPEQGLLAIRKELQLFANLRPIKVFPQLASSSPLKEELLVGVDLLVVRELTGGIYFGERGRPDADTAFDTMAYTRREVERIAHLAFKIAGGRTKKVTSVDKANVLDVSRLWRQVVIDVSADYPDITLEHQLVDSAAMRLITNPASMDVLVTGNMFGDILSDEASVLGGSLGMLPSASLGEETGDGNPVGLYEPVHGSAPDIAGQGIANPLATILSAALLLRHSLGLEEEAAKIEAAVDQALADGARSRDLGGGEQVLSTEAMGDVVIANL